MVEHQASAFDLPMIAAPPSLCTDNAAMIAWMGHELRNVEQDVDLRTLDI